MNNVKEEKIELSEFIKDLEEKRNKYFREFEYGYLKGATIDTAKIPLTDFLAIISDAKKIKGTHPSVWLERNGKYKCQKCGNVEEADYNYCNNCGAIMTRVEKEK